MKCPYQTTTIHKPEYVSGERKHFAEDVVIFGDCVKDDCPFYYTGWANGTVEHCRKAESEGKE